MKNALLLPRPVRSAPSNSDLSVLASAVAGLEVRVDRLPAGTRSYTDGATIYLESGLDRDHTEWALLAQALMIAGGGLEGKQIRALRGRPALARTYPAFAARILGAGG